MEMVWYNVSEIKDPNHEIVWFRKGKLFCFFFLFPFYEIWNSHHHNVLELAFNVEATINVLLPPTSKPSLDI